MGKTETESKILHAARHEFLANGFAGTRMRCIAERAEINKGLLHYYFKNKDTLLIEVFQETFAELFLALSAALHPNMNVFDQVKSIVNIYTDFILRHPQLPHFIIAEMNRDLNAHFNRMKKAGIRPPFKVFIDAVNRAKTENSIRADVCPEQLVLNIISLILFPVVAKEMVKFMHNRTESSYKEMMQERKTIVSNLIIQSLSTQHTT